MNKLAGKQHLLFLILSLIFLSNIIFCQDKPNLIIDDFKFINHSMVKTIPGTKYFDELKGSVLEKNIEYDTSYFTPVPGPIGGSITSISLDSTGNLFISTSGGVYKSTDNGLNWYLHLFPSQLYNSIEPVTVLGPNIIAAETDFGNYISWDGAETWERFHQDAVGFSLDSTGKIYAGSFSSGARISFDTAKTWQSFALSGKIWTVVKCGQERMACPSDSGTYYSTDNGVSWLFRHYDTPFTWNLVYDGKGHLFVLKYYGGSFLLFRSNDFGATWENIVLPVSGDPYRIYIKKDGTVYVPVNNWILITDDGGENWKQMYFPDGNVSCVGWDDQSNLLAACSDGMFRYDKISNEWENISNGIHSRRIENILFTKTNTILVCSIQNCFRSSNSGENWNKIKIDPSTIINHYPAALSASSGNIFISAIFDNYNENGLIRSTDDGITWERLSVLSNRNNITGVLEGPDGRIFVSTFCANIFMTTDQGETWNQVANGKYGENISCMDVDANSNYYAIKDSTFLESKDGISWTEKTFKRNSDNWVSMCIDLNGNIYFSSDQNGVFLSNDRGKTWELINDGLLDTYVICSAADDSGNVVLGAYDRPYILKDSINSWQSLNTNFPQTFTTSISFSNEGILFAGTQSYGMYRYTAPLKKRFPTINIQNDSLSPAPPPSQPINNYDLFQNYPNPFNDATIIHYQLPGDGFVTLKVYDILGREVATLINEQEIQGKYSIKFSAPGLANGVYIYRLIVNGYICTKKMLFLK